MYTKTSDTTAVIQTASHQFHLDSQPVDFSKIGIEADQEMINEEQARATLHANLINHFEQNPSSVDVFVAMVDANPSTAFTQFVNQNRLS